MVKFFRAKKSHSRASEKVKFEKVLQPWRSFSELKGAILEHWRRLNLKNFFNHGEVCKRQKGILKALGRWNLKISFNLSEGFTKGPLWFQSKIGIFLTMIRRWED